jgi:hypothetical protein
MLSSSTHFKQHPQAVFIELDAEVAIFQSSSCEYLVLNESGSAIWNALAARPSLADLCMLILRDFDVSPQQCIADAEDWLAVALEKQIVIAFEN